tara:strand:- start:95 stop:328 length:234 start_codon:yes stop_codon:yes gene_type:complete
MNIVNVDNNIKKAKTDVSDAPDHMWCKGSIDMKKAVSKDSSSFLNRRYVKKKIRKVVSAPINDVRYNAVKSFTPNRK